MKKWNQSFIYYWINPEILAIEPKVRDDLREIMEVPMSKTLVQIGARDRADIRITPNDEIDTTGKTTFYYKGDTISTVYCYINLERLAGFKEDDYFRAIRNCVRHEFLHALLCVHRNQDEVGYQPLMSEVLNADKIYWTKDDKKQLKTLYPIKS